MAHGEKLPTSMALICANFTTIAEEKYENLLLFDNV